MFNDPRDKRFNALKKKDQSQLSPFERDELTVYIDKILAQTLAKKVRRGWIEYKNSLSKEA